MPEKISVHEKALGHLTKGLYRSPASAIRELISNAWDADATEVTINTGRPVFHRLSIKDNGIGFPKSDFEALMKGFGNSDKRLQPSTSKHGREVVGRLGIGLLGIAQICGSFTIRSRPKSGTGFTAKIVLFDQLRRDLDEVPTGNSRVSSADGRDDTIDVGEYEFIDDQSWTKMDQGTQIETDDLISTFISAFADSYYTVQQPLGSTQAEKKRPPKAKPIPTSWEGFLERAASVGTIDELGDYWRWLWELAALSPVPYLTADVLPQSAIAAYQTRLIGYQFKLMVDGMDVRKPVSLSGNPAGYYVHAFEETTKNVFREPLVFSGYFVVQIAKQIRPSNLRGLLVRIREVGVGLYDQSMLDFQYNEGPRAHWLTGELYVRRGLDDALNVDRDSFNRYSPEFQVLQQEVHRLLRKEVFPKVYAAMARRQNKKEHNRTTQRLVAVADALTHSRESGGPRVTIVASNATKQPKDGVELLASGSQVQVRISENGLEGLRRNNALLGAAIVAAYDTASQTRELEARRDRFISIIRDLLAKW